MKFYLAKDESVLLSTRNASQAQPEGYKNYCPTLQQVYGFGFSSPAIRSLTPIMSEKVNGDFWPMEKLRKCGQLLLKSVISQASKTVGARGNMDLRFLVVRDLIEGSSMELTVQLEEEEGTHKGWILNSLRKICGDKVKINFELFFVPYSNAGLVTGSMAIPEDNICLDDQIKVSKRMAELWMSVEYCSLEEVDMFGHWAATYNLILEVDDNLELFRNVLHSGDSSTNRKILEGGIGSDFEIVANNGAVFKCHRSFLMVHSPVFTKMLESGMVEATTNRMEMPDLSEACLRTLLAFLYCGDEWEVPTGNLDLALEILKAAHMYEINRLERILLEMFENKPDIYFTLEFATELFQFVSNIPTGGDGVMEKAMRIINMESPEED